MLTLYPEIKPYATHDLKVDVSDHRSPQGHGGEEPIEATAGA